MKGAIDLFHPVGSIYITDTNTNPSSIFGGEWTLIDKDYVNKTYTDTTLFSPSTNVICNECYVLTTSNSHRVRLKLTINTTITDTTLQLGTLNYQSFGVKQLPMSYIYEQGYGDGANGGFIFQIHYATGAISIYDVISADSLSSGNSYYLLFDLPINVGYRIDSFCDKFYWCRTS